MAGAEQVVGTGVGGTLPLTTIANSASISSTADFSSIAALYTAYRCRAIRVQIIAMHPVPYYTGTVGFNAPSVIAYFPWQANTVPTTFAQACDVTGVKLVSGYNSLVLSTSYRGDPDAHLWTGTGSAIGSSENFGVSCVGTATAATASSNILKVIPQYLVEFRMAG